jgi:hypothetical protein
VTSTLMVSKNDVMTSPDNAALSTPLRVFRVDARGDDQKNASATLRYSGDEAMRLKDKRKTLTKLTNGSLDSRSISHPLHIGADLCKELSIAMEAAKLMERSWSNWERIGQRD